MRAPVTAKADTREAHGGSMWWPRSIREPHEHGLVLLAPHTLPRLGNRGTRRRASHPRRGSANRANPPAPARYVLVNVTPGARLCPQFYRPLNIRIVLVGVEVWNDLDKCPISQDPFTSLHEFLDWRKMKLLPRKPHDNAQLIR